MIDGLHQGLVPGRWSLRQAVRQVVVLNDWTSQRPFPPAERASMQLHLRKCLDVSVDIKLGNGPLIGVVVLPDTHDAQSKPGGVFGVGASIQSLPRSDLRATATWA